MVYAQEDCFPEIVTTANQLVPRLILIKPMGTHVRLIPIVVPAVAVQREAEFTVCAQDKR